MASAQHRFHRLNYLRGHASTTALLCITLFTTATLPAQIMDQHHTFRDLSGIVTDGHEPIRGAIVELESENSHEVVTYVTEADGHYHFKRLNGEQDYRVWVVFRNRHSKTHEISKFDDHMDKVINFEISPF